MLKTKMAAVKRMFTDPCKHWWIILYAISVHTIWGIVLLFASAPIAATPIEFFYHVLTSNVALAAMLIIAAALAALGVVWESRNHWVLLLFMPQQTILMCSGIRALTAVIQSQYADGIQRPRNFILVDQLPTMLLAIAYTAAVFDLSVLVGIRARARARARARDNK